MITVMLTSCLLPRERQEYTWTFTLTARRKTHSTGAKSPQSGSAGQRCPHALQHTHSWPEMSRADIYAVDGCSAGTHKWIFVGGEIDLRVMQSDQDVDGQVGAGEGGAGRKPVHLGCAFHASGLLQPPLLQSEVIPPVFYRPTAPLQSFLTGAGQLSTGGSWEK